MQAETSLLPVWREQTGIFFLPQSKILRSNWEIAIQDHDESNDVSPRISDKKEAQIEKLNEIILHIIIELKKL